jgi:C-terminal processing protease CtpA/Prc
MELVAIDGRPVEEVLKRDIYPVVSASTPQSRDAIAFYRALEGEPNTKVLATFLDLNGARRTYELTRDSTRHQDAFPSRPLMEFRELPGGIAYVALNSFGNDKLAARFDGYWEQILNSKGLILDVRHNQGGSSENGFAVVARLISQPAPTSTSRTRCYKPTERARGKAEEWYEYPPEKIEPRGEKPYMGTVAVLVGDDTFSAAEDFLVPLKATKRATLIGSPSAGSTGQPLVFGLYGTNVRICTKWDRFPDGTEFVGVGVQPDILVEPTRQDIAQGKDPVLERAIAFIQAR